MKNDFTAFASRDLEVRVAALMQHSRAVLFLRRSHLPCLLGTFQYNSANREAHKSPKNHKSEIAVDDHLDVDNGRALLRFLLNLLCVVTVHKPASQLCVLFFPLPIWFLLYE